jgi:hypothetical protein
MSLVQGVNAVLVKSWTHVNWRAVQHSARTAVAAVISLIVARLFHLLLGLICASLHLDRAAYRFAGITFAIIALVAHSQPAWIIAAHRFFEVSIGIAVGLLITAAWPERQSAT